MRQVSIFILMVALVIMAMACGQQEAPTTKVLASATTYASIEEAKAAVAESGRPIIVDFYTDW